MGLWATARTAVLTLAAIGVLSCGRPPAVDTAAPAAQPVPPAPVGDAIMQLELVDTSRPTAAAPGVPASASRSLPTTVYLPPGSGPAPLIVLAHGAAGGPEKFTELASFWAAHGYVVAVPRFPLTNDEVPDPVIADFPEQGRDVRFVIDEVLARSAAGGDLAGRVDPQRIGLFGLSLGSLTVWSTVFDGPVDALIQSDGTTLVADDRIGEIAFPVLVAHSDTDPIFRYADVLARYDALPGPKFLLTLHGAAHAAVAENTDTAADNAYLQATTAFWDRTLGGRADVSFPPPLEGVTSFVAGPRPSGTLPGTR